VQLAVFNVAGRLVRTLVEKDQVPGAYTVIWDGRDASGSEMASGIYLYRLATSDLSVTKKLVLLR
jgi:flagellar hook assembly protein FlgD